MSGAFDSFISHAVSDCVNDGSDELCPVHPSEGADCGICALDPIPSCTDHCFCNLPCAQDHGHAGKCRCLRSRRVG